MNQIEIAKLIINQNGSCNGVRCEDCQAYFTKQGLNYSCTDLWSNGTDEDCRKWFENWLKEQEGEVSDKIQMTEEQARGIIECIFGTAFEFVENDGIVYIQRLRENGYIIKSELQQKVERVEASLKDYIDGHSVDILDTFKASIDVIQFLKQSHPEFKGGER